MRYALKIQQNYRPDLDHEPDILEEIVEIPVGKEFETLRDYDIEPDDFMIIYNFQSIAGFSRNDAGRISFDLNPV